MSSMMDQILSGLPIDQIAERLGTDPDTAEDAVRRALPALLSGLDLEVQTGKAESLASAALQDHDPDILTRDNPLAFVDAADGEKILGHLFGSDRTAVEQRLAAGGKAEAGLFSKLLPMLAPLVMSWLAGRLRNKAGADGGGGATTADEGGGGLGDLLGGLLGGGGGFGGGIGDLLGGILGGEKEAGKQAMPDLGGLFDMFTGGDGDDRPDLGDLLGPR